eukprot:TRINITY_DN5017_c0_g1_i1.p1 TRINITY_DN5017_c0_g1~~TRINITY_DN5017_c0_g1_i1.p1  ORF type:complete len:61 (-),score=0.04 TRINITY_DN5017_c0_g1_i1:69-251(-)
MSDHNFSQILPLHHEHRDEAFHHMKLHNLPVISREDIFPSFSCYQFAQTPALNPNTMEQI